MSWISEPIDGIANVNLNVLKKSSSLCRFRSSGLLQDWHACSLEVTLSAVKVRAFVGHLIEFIKHMALNCVRGSALSALLKFI